MNLLKVIKAEYLGSYSLELTFNNGIHGEIDLREKIFTDHRNIFKSLRKEDYFKNFTLNRWTIEWGNGLDLAPFLFDLLKEQNKNISVSSEM